MINGFRINIQRIAIVSGLSKRDSETVAATAVENILAVYYTNILRLADKKLNTSRRAYTEGLSIVQHNRLKGSIVLEGDLANMMEQGASAFDMKVAFGKSSKRKNGKNGWYMHIPFRIASAGATGKSGAFSGKMSKRVYGVALTMQKTRTQQTDNGMETTKGDSMTKGMLRGTGSGTRGARAAIKQEGNNLSAEQRARYTHRVPLFQGMIRQGKTYEKSDSSQYKTFRTVSENSPINSWIHRGMKARNLFDEAIRLSNTNTIITNTVADFLETKGL